MAQKIPQEAKWSRAENVECLRHSLQTEIAVRCRFKHIIVFYTAGVWGNFLVWITIYTLSLFCKHYGVQINNLKKTISAGKTSSHNNVFKANCWDSLLSLSQ